MARQKPLSAEIPPAVDSDRVVGSGSDVERAEERLARVDRGVDDSDAPRRRVFQARSDAAR
eukprot:1533379-Rhodomonas_salina.1